MIKEDQEDSIPDLNPIIFLHQQLLGTLTHHTIDKLPL